MGDATKTRMGVCNVSFNSVELGYTKGNVSVEYGIESSEIEVDQEDVPIDEIVTKQSFVVKVPMAEYDLATLATLLPGATLVTDAVDATKKKLTLSGAAEGSMLDLAEELVLAPVGGDANDAVTLHHAVPVPSINFAYEKDNLRVWEITFKAVKGVNGWVTLGDTTAAAT